ncbi:MAG: ATP-binding protein [Burkholderiales bacterium]
MSAATPSAQDIRRVALLTELGVLDTPPEDSFDTLVRCAATASGCSVAMLSLLEVDRLWFKAAHGVPETECPLQGSFCELAFGHNDLFVVNDAKDDARFSRHPWVVGPYGLRFYASVPVLVEGVRVGSLCVLHAHAPGLIPATEDVLWQLARLATSLLESRRHSTQLQLERERMSDLARASGDWMWEVDANCRCTWVSDSFEAITHIPAHQVLGAVLDDGPLLDAQGEVIPGMSFLELLAKQQPFVRLTTLRQTPLGPMSVSRSAVPRFDASGQFAGFRGTARDVSESIRVHQQLATQVALLRKLSTQVPGLIFQYQQPPSGRGRYLYTSDAVRDLFGVQTDGPGNEVDARLPYRLLHDDDRQAYHDSAAQASRQIEPWRHEYRIHRGDGHVRWMETRATPERLPDGGTLWHGFTTDITDRKQTELALRESQERVEMASEAAGIGIVEIDLNQGLVVLDRRACANHGLRYPQEQLTVPQWMAVLHQEDQAEVGRALQKTLISGGTLQLRYRARFADGRTPTLELLARAVYGPKGRTKGWVGTCRDISAALVSERLMREKEAAERANRAKSEFLSRVSHELRTPLNGILGFAQLMQLDRTHPLQGDQQRRLESVLRAGRHLLDLINEVLDLSRIESEDYRLKIQAVNLADSVSACLNLVQPLADGSAVRLPSAPLPTQWVQADHRALEQVLMNLLSNAIKYNRPHGAVHLELRAEQRQVVLSIRDEGLGLSTEQQAALFQPFNRLGAERTRIEGSGLGLVISRDLMRAMGGALHVQSAIGQGATFSLTLPLGQAAEPAASESTSPPNADAPMHAPTQRVVLYVEDEPLNVVLMEEIFRKRPHWTLRIATDGRQGLESARAHQPDLLLVDMNLPDMRGVDLLRLLRADESTRHMRCIVLSADVLPDQVAAALEAGFSDYWTKPIDVSLVLGKLEQWLKD